MSAFRPGAVAALCLLTLGIVSLAADAPEGNPPNQQVLGFESTDKPIYRAGEIVYIRTVVLGANTHKPLADGSSDTAMVRVTGPKGEILGSGYARMQDSVVGYAWNIPPGATGGQYKVVTEFPYSGYPPAERKFEVRAYRTPRLKGEIVFLRDGFGPGDLVQASLHVERAEGGVPAGASVDVNAIVDGASAYHGTTTVDAQGNCAVQLTLPTQISVGDGTLSLAVSDGGVVEPIAKTIPILVNSVDISFYPEGGDLVAGLSDRVYLEARTPAKKPADIRGQIIDSHGSVVAEVNTAHEGRGRFTFTPRLDESYSLKLLEPAGISRLFPLPGVVASGVTLTAANDVTEKDQPLVMRCAATDGGDYTLTLRKHNTEICSRGVDLQPGVAADVSVDLPAWADGVLTATISGPFGFVKAERLVFRQSDHNLRVTVTADKPIYMPGDSATITVTTADENGNPVPAVVGITATDSTVLEMPEQRDRAPRLSEMVLLENDVRELADAQVYLDPTDPKGPMAVDLLLGTQGWRRFATADEAKFLAEYGDAGRRALADRQPPRPPRPAIFGGGFGGGGGAGGRRAFGGARGGMGGAGAVPMELGVQGGVDLGAAAAAAASPPGDFVLAEKEAAAGDVIGNDEMHGLMLMPAGRLARRSAPEVRIYAHDLAPDYHPGQRADFTETLYWSAGVATSSDTGTATVSFQLNDSVTSFKVRADGFDSSGALGEGTATVTSVEPFYIEPKLPLEVTAGDVIRLPIAVVNGTYGTLNAQMILQADSPLTIGPVAPLSLAPGGRDRRVSEIAVGAVPGVASVRIQASAGDYSDQVTRQLTVKPLGFPTEISKGGLLDPNAQVTHAIEIPDSLVRGSLVASAALYPTPVGNLTEALKRLMQEPYGCFEQTSSTTYPLVMADQYFMSHSGVDPRVIAQSNELLDKGYQRLLGFECQNKGYEWFGEDPGHECLSAYAILEFTDMSAVRTVDAGMLADTRKWLLARRDGKGGFTHERRALHTWITDPDCADSYCTWALLESGEKNLDPEVRRVKEVAASDTNSYVKALAANVLSLSGDKEGAKHFMDELAARQESDGHVSGATASIVGSEGESLQIETASLATLAWLRDSAYAGNVERAVEFLANSCQDGRYGSTQSTVLALRAIVRHDQVRAHPAAAGTVQLLIDGAAVGEPMAFNTDTKGAIQLPDFSNLLTPGKHAVALRMSKGASLPYVMDVAFNSIKPASSDLCKVSIDVSLKDAQLTEGGTTEADAIITNRTGAAIPTPIAIVGLPGGLEVRYDQLKELVKAQRIAAYEVRGREVILYWRDLEANQTVRIPLSLTAAVPGDYTGPASRAYLYYTDEYKQWADGLKVSIAAK
ncbi:MAG: alpha-2-macroglobulin family protein [Tepidisphaeraceae bacterium]